MEISTVPHITINGNATICQWGYAPVYAGLMAFVGVVIFAENLTGLWVILTSPALRTTTNIFVCSMAGADLLAALACIATNVTILVAETSSSVPIVVARYAISLLIFVFSMVIFSCAHMALIAIERFLFIAHPYFYQKHAHGGKVRKVLGWFWLVGVTFMTVFVVIYYHKDDVFSSCNRILPSNLALALSFTIYGLSVIICFGSYLCIAKISFSQRRRLVGISTINTASASAQSVGDHRNALIGKEALKSAKFFMVVFGLFFLFTFPPALVFVIDGATELPDMAFRASTAVAILNSGVNFVVLFIVSKPFRTAAKNKVKRLFSNQSEIELQ